jgi:hypothetical protein
MPTNAKSNNGFEQDKYIRFLYRTYYIYELLNLSQRFLFLFIQILKK